MTWFQKKLFSTIWKGHSDIGAYLLRQLHYAAVPCEELVGDFRAYVIPDDARWNGVHGVDAKRLRGDHPKESVLHFAHEAVVCPDT